MIDTILKSLMGLESFCLQLYQTLKQLMEVAEPQSILSNKEWLLGHIYRRDYEVGIRGDRLSRHIVCYPTS